MKLSDALRRAIRTWFQAFFGVLVGSGILSATAETGVVDGTWIKKVAISASAAGFTALTTFVHNFAEDSEKIALPSVLKKDASDGVHPVTEDPAVVPAVLPPSPAAKKAKPRKVAAKKAAK